jgi:UV DNA damage repair endonuclease
MSSVLFPWMGTFEVRDVPQYEEIRAALRHAGDLARLHGQRLTFHPRCVRRHELTCAVRVPAVCASLKVSQMDQPSQAAASMSCSHFVKLASMDEQLTQKSLKELEAHSQVTVRPGLRMLHRPGTLRRRPLLPPAPLTDARAAHADHGHAGVRALALEQD